MALAGSAQANAARPCVASGVLNDDDITVEFRGTEPFDVRLYAASKVQVTLDARARPVVLAANDAIAVSAPGVAPLYLLPAPTFMHPFVVLDRPARLRRPRYRGGRIEADVVLAHDIVLLNVRAGCEAVVAGSPPARTSPSASPVQEETEVEEFLALVRPRLRTLTLHVTPRSKETLRVRMDDEHEWVRFDVVRRKRGWTRVRWTGVGGALSGWVSSRAVMEVDPYSLTGTGTGVACCGVHPLAIGSTRRKGTLRAGVEILESAAGKAWATTTAAVEGVEVEDVPGKAWLRVLLAPAVYEISCDPKRTWVRREDVALSPSATSSAVDAAELF